MTPPHVDQLLAQRTWLRRLAAAIVGDAQADDIVQQTVAAALASPPRDAARLRGWLARVARHFAWKHVAGERRRAERESQAARDEALAPAEELLARIEEQHVVTRAVAALDEPYRSTLLWRYFEDLSVDEIARRAGHPASTIRTRIQRGLERVRRRLEAERGRDWRLAVLPLLKPDPAVAIPASGGLLTSLGGLLMTTQGKLAIVALVLVAALLTAIPFGRENSRSEDVARAGASAEESPSTDSPTTALDRAELDPRHALVPVPTEEESAATPRASLRGVVLDTTGAPLRDVPLVAVPGDGVDEALPLGHSDRSGGFRFEPTSDPAAGVEIRCGPGWFTLHAAVVDGNTTAEDDLFLIAAPTVLRAGHVVDEQGTPIEGVEVAFEWWSLASFPRELESVRAHPLPETRTAADGSFRLTGCPGTEQLELYFRRQGYVEERLTCSAHDDPGVVVTLRSHVAGSQGFRALVVDEAGAGVRGALVSHGGAEAISDELGRVELPWSRGPARLLAVVSGKQPWVRARFGHEAWRADGAPDPLRIVLVKPELRIVGHVYDELGDPLGDVPVTFERGTAVRGRETAEAIALGRDPRQTLELTRTDEYGRFELRGLADRTYMVTAYDAETLECVRKEVPAGTEDALLRFRPGSLLRDVDAVCVDGQGEPLAGIEVGLMLQVTYGYDGQLVRPALATTDEHGRFRLDQLPLGEAWVTFRGSAILDAFHEVSREDAQGTGPLRFVLEKASSVRFVPSGADDEGCHAGLMRTDGTLVSLWVYTRNERMFDLTWEIANGVSPVYKVDAGEYTLVVTRNGKFLREETVRIVDAELNEIAVP